MRKDNLSRREPFMKITCERGLIKRTGLVGFKWSASFAFKISKGTLADGQFESHVSEVRKLTGLCSVFVSWLNQQADFPSEGEICSITLTP